MAKVISFDEAFVGFHGRDGYEQLRQRRTNAWIDREIEAAAHPSGPFLVIRPWPPIGYFAGGDFVETSPQNGRHTRFAQPR